MKRGSKPIGETAMTRAERRRLCPRRHEREKGRWFTSHKEPFLIPKAKRLRPSRRTTPSIGEVDILGKPYITG
jgi:hypothetical protein